MPRGKQFCPYENNFFPSAEFTLIDGIQVHGADPPHRATDGVVLSEEDGEGMSPLSNMAFVSAEEEAEL